MSPKWIFIPNVSPSITNGYIAGGVSGGASGGTAISSIQKISFSNDTSITTVASGFGLEPNSSGVLAAESRSDSRNFGFGTQSSDYGYRVRAIYASLSSITNYSSVNAAHKMSFQNEAVSTIRLTSSSPFISNNRRPTSQSSSAAYILGASSPYSAKLTFSTDATSTPISTSSLASANTAGAVSTDTHGIYFTGAVSNVVRPLQFSTETVSSVSAAQNFTSSNSEMVDSSTTGYSQNTATTTASGTSNCRKFNKTTYDNSVLSTTLGGAGGASAATQGTIAGYFCGGQNYSASDYSIGTIGSSVVKKIIFSSETYQTHGTSLSGNTILAAGFER